MNLVLLITALVILLCVWLNILSGKLGVPVLLAFILLGMAFGTGFAIIAKYVINKAIIKTPDFDIVFIIAIVLLAYVATSTLGGNGYLSVYITGIILGNTDILGKKELVPFFDGITGLMQIVIFFPFGTPCISFKASSDSSDCLNFGGLYHTYCQTVYGVTAAAV